MAHGRGSEHRPDSDPGFTQSLGSTPSTGLPETTGSNQATGLTQTTGSTPSTGFPRLHLSMRTTPRVADLICRGGNRPHYANARCTSHYAKARTRSCPSLPESYATAELRGNRSRNGEQAPSPGVEDGCGPTADTGCRMPDTGRRTQGAGEPRNI